MRTTLTLIGALVVIVMGILYGSPLAIFVDLPSVLFTISIPVLALLSRYHFKEIISMSSEVRELGISSSILGGGIGSIVGFIQMLQNLSDPSSIGPALAVTLLSAFYALLLCVFFVFGKKTPINLTAVRYASIGAVAVVLIVFPYLIISLAKDRL